jgi:hypothetical protein
VVVVSGGEMRIQKALCWLQGCHREKVVLVPCPTLSTPVTLEATGWAWAKRVRGDTERVHGGNLVPFAHPVSVLPLLVSQGPLSESQYLLGLSFPHLDPGLGS